MTPPLSIPKIIKGDTAEIDRVLKAPSLLCEHAETTVAINLGCEESVWDCFLRLQYPHAIRSIIERGDTLFDSQKLPQFSALYFTLRGLSAGAEAEHHASKVRKSDCDAQAYDIDEETGSVCSEFNGFCKVDFTRMIRSSVNRAVVASVEHEVARYMGYSEEQCLAQELCRYIPKDQWSAPDLGDPGLRPI